MTLTIDDIQQAGERLAGTAVKTPLLVNDALNDYLSAKIYIKAENLQRVGAFKFRGAFNRLIQFTPQQRKYGAVAFSSGNHAQGVALAARILGMPATIVMPGDAPTIKIEGTRRYGAQIRFYNRKTESREQIAATIASETGQILVPAFDDLQVMAGQGTCGLEITEQLQSAGDTPDILLCPCGGGGLLAGVSTAVTTLLHGISVYGVEPEGFDDHLQSKLAGERRGHREPGQSFCDALLADKPGELTWTVNSKTTSGFLTVTDAEVASAMDFAFRHLKLVLEPGGAVALAAALHRKIPLKNKVVVIILSGGNVDPAVFIQCLRQKTDSPASLKAG